MTSDNAVRDTSMDRLVYGPWIGQGWNQVPHHPNVMVRANSVLRVHPMEERGEVNRRLQDVRELVDAGAPLLAPKVPYALDGENGYSVATVWPRCKPNTSVTGLIHALQRLHAIPAPPSVRLQPPNNIDMMHSRLDHVDVEPDIRIALEIRAAVAQQLFDGIDTSDGVVLHNDAHVGNSVVCGGEVLLINHDGMAVGPAEWDFLSLLHEAVRGGGDVERVPGVDWGLVRSWLPIKDATSCAWLATVPGDAARAELRARLFVPGHIWR